MALKYPPFAACMAMEQAARSAPPLRQGSHGAAVALLQGALVQLKEKLPLSIKKSGAPDGAFGAETLKAVISFQTTAKLKPDGVAGAKTIQALDAEMAKMMPVAPPPAPPPQGLAKEFDCYGSFKRRFTWKKGAALPPQQLYAAGGR